MAYVGHYPELDLKELETGTYYRIKDTDEVFDSEQDIEEYSWEWTPNNPKSGESEFYFSWEEIEEAGYEESEGEWLQPDYLPIETFEIPEMYVALEWVNDYEESDDEDTIHYEVTATTTEGGYGSIRTDDEWRGGNTLNETITIAHEKAKELSSLPEYENNLFVVGYDTLFAGYDEDLAAYRNGKIVSGSKSFFK